jgi:hypothetical protein
MLSETAFVLHIKLELERKTTYLYAVNVRNQNGLQTTKRFPVLTNCKAVQIRVVLTSK